MNGKVEKIVAPGRSRWRSSLPVFVFVAGLLGSADAEIAGTSPPGGSGARGGADKILAQAERVDADGRVAVVTLPDQVESAVPGEPARATYRWSLMLPAGTTSRSLCFPGLIAHARLSVNGHPIFDTLGDGTSPLPRSADRLVLADVPDSLWLPGENSIELTAAGPHWFSISPIQIGPSELIHQHRLVRMMSKVLGPAMVAIVLGTLGLCLLFLWTRRHEPLYGYFGAGTLAWCLHSLWSVLPMPLLPGIHDAVGWISLYGFFVSMLVIFCLRFSEWNLPRCEKALWVFALSGPAVLYSAIALGQFGAVEEVWRLGMLLIVSLGLAAVARAAWRQRTTDSSLIALTGLVSLLLATHDFAAAKDPSDNNPIYLVPFAGLFFCAVVVRMLVNRFVVASQQMEAANAELEVRVEQRSAELRSALEQMRQARGDAEAADRAKTRFLAAASHDLRQPAHALGLYLAALRADDLTAGQVDLVDRIGNSLDALDSLFKTLLDVSRIDGGAVVPEQKVLALGPLLRHLADEFAPQAEARGLRLSLRMADVSAKLWVRSDPQLLERILRNLLANAVKYTPRGGILLACRPRTVTGKDERGISRRFWRIEVWDSGVGISSSDQERVFEEFFQVNNAGRDRNAGLGLGLAIVNRLVRLLNLRLDLRSRVGRG
ncbi:MAG TPA: ATP-binding protein, partial [Acidimicrobiia bacterium]